MLEAARTFRATNGVRKKSYAEPCPLHWLEIVDGGCAAGPSYSGPCRRTLTFGFTLEEKREAETICAVSWPSPDGCPRDWAAQCPYGVPRLQGRSQRLLTLP